MSPRAAVLLLAALLFACPSLAQQRRQPNTSGPSALETHAARMEHDAEQDLKAGNPAGRYFVDIDMVFPADKAEYEAVGKQALLVFALFSADRAALPLGGARVGGVPLKCLKSIVRDVPAKSATAKAFGKFRADTLCVLPVEVGRKSSTVTIDFARTFKGLDVSYPFEEPGFVKADLDPGTRQAPDPAALQKFIDREFPGFGFRVRP